MEQVKIGEHITWTVKTNTPKKDLREAVKEQIRLHPETYNQSMFCGTECCIAGHAGMLLRDSADVAFGGSDADLVYEWKERMLSALGVKEELFGYGFNWRGELSTMWMNAETNEDRVEVACKAIDYYAIED